MISSLKTCGIHPVSLLQKKAEEGAFPENRPDLRLYFDEMRKCDEQA